MDAAVITLMITMVCHLCRLLIACTVHLCQAVLG